jgi:hypothetical protein
VALLKKVLIVALGIGVGLPVVAYVVFFVLYVVSVIIFWAGSVSS